MYDEFNPCDPDKNDVQKKHIDLKDSEGESNVEETDKNDMFIEVKIQEKAGEQSSLILYFDKMGDKIDWFSILTGEMVPGEEEMSDDDIKD
jgi:hypothetical protein